MSHPTEQSAESIHGWWAAALRALHAEHERRDEQLRDDALFERERPQFDLGEPPGPIPSELLDVARALLECLHDQEGRFTEAMTAVEAAARASATVESPHSVTIDPQSRFVTRA